jgi:hypothetical protein
LEAILWSSCTLRREELQNNAQIKNNQPPDMIKKVLKSKVSATEIKVGITLLKREKDG